MGYFEHTEGGLNLPKPCDVLVRLRSKGLQLGHAAETVIPAPSSEL